MARVRNAVGIVAEVTDTEADRLAQQGWTLLEQPPKKKAPARKAPAKKTEK